MWAKLHVARISAREDQNILFCHVIVCKGRRVIIL